VKRRIDVSQLNELTDGQKQKLREWWKPEPGDWYYSPCNDGTYQPYGLYMWHDDGIEKYKPLPALDIGQMIELLQNCEKYPGHISIWDGNLCDNLFEKVKEVL